MGNFWTIEASNSQKLSFLNRVTCDEALKISKEMIIHIIEKVHKTKNYENTQDFKKYRLYPGQQIFYENALAGIKGATHCGIYLYDGIIIEAASAPKHCISNLEKNKTYFGYNTIEAFKKFGLKTRKSKTSKVITEKDHQKTEIIKRLQRAKKIVGPQNFELISSNCVQFANYVTFGKKRWTFPKETKVELIN
jgi:hypothetical protein